MPTGIVADMGLGTLGAPGLFVGPRRTQGVIHITERDDAPGQRNLFAFQAVRVAAAIPAFVVRNGDFRGQVGQR